MRTWILGGLIVAATATIELEGMRSGWSVWSSHGEVKGDEIIGIPADTIVSIHAEWIDMNRRAQACTKRPLSGPPW